MRDKKGGFLSGKNHWNWKGGITPTTKKIKNSPEFRLWRISVFERDNYTCIWCSSTEKLIADHIKPFAYYPELRFAIDNGRTLCEPCHKTTDTYGKHIQSEEATLRLIAYNHSKKGKPLPKEHRENISKAKKGKEFSEEHRKNLSMARRKVLGQL